MKHIVPFVVDLPKKENYFELGRIIAGGKTVSIKNKSVLRVLKEVLGQKIHVHGRGFPFPEACGLFAQKSVYAPHSDTVGQNFLTKLIRRIEFNMYDRVIVSTENTRENFVKDGVDAERISVVPNPIDYEFFSKPKGGSTFRKKFGLGKNEKFILAVGIWSVKNPKVIIDACRTAGVKAVLAGDIPEKHVTKKFQYALPSEEIKNDDNTILTGRLSHKELLSALDTATIFVNSSKYESFGIAVYEAAAAGLPLCLPKLETFKIFKKCALFHEKHDTDRLARNIEKYLNNVKLRKSNVQKAKLLAKRFDYPLVLKKLEEVYREVGFI